MNTTATNATTSLRLTPLGHWSSGLHSVLCSVRVSIWAPSSKVLVLGASTSVASCFIQIAKNYSHIGTVVGTCNSRSVDFNKAKGFDYLVTYDEGDTVEKIKELIANELNGEKFDLIFDTVGNKQFFPVINEVLKPMSANSQYVTIAGDAKLIFSTQLTRL